MTSLSHALRICVSAVLIRRMLLWVRKEKWACTPTSARKGSCGSKCPPPFASPTLWTGLFQPPREELGSKPAHLPAVRRPFWIMEASHKAAFRDQLSLREDPSVGPQFLHPHEQIDEGLGKSSQDLVSL